MKNNLGKLQSAAMKFYSANQGWHSFSNKCATTRRVIRSLENRGLLEVNEFFQARAK